MLLAAKLAALRGYSTTVAVAQDYGDAVDAPTLVYGKDADDSLLPLTLLPASPSTKGFDPTVARAAIAAADGVIVAFDDDSTLDESILNTWIPMDKSQAKHICFMSRYLNGAGMGPFAVAARKTANLDVWTASPRQVAALRAAESSIVGRAQELGATHTIIRAGTLKGGASGSGGQGVETTGSGGFGGDARFLDPFLYDAACTCGGGTADFVNWKMLFDCQTLGATLSRGDTLPGPGFTAILTAISEDACAGDSGRGAVAEALVEALACDAAAGGDFSVATAAGRAAPSREEWASMFVDAS